MLLQLGWVPTIAISSAESARDVLKIQDHECCNRPLAAGFRRLTYNYKDVAFSPYGDYWRRIRKLSVLELFNSKRIESFRPIREEEVASLMNSISWSSSTATPVNLTEKIYPFFASGIFKIASGKNFQGSNFDNSRFQELIHEAETIVGCFSAEEYLAYAGWIINRLTGYHARVNRIFLKLDTFFQQVIHDNLKPGRNLEQEDIVDVLLKMERDQTGTGDEQFTNDNIKAVLLNLFVGGVGTGAATADWTMEELARNSRAMKKVQEEIRKSVGIEGSVSEGNMDQLPYLKMVIKETLRLHPPAPLLIAREVMGHFITNGCDIYPKMLIHVNVWAIGRDPKYWKDPEEFFPDRFADSSVDFRGQHFEFLPFGSGCRVCPGVLLGTRTVEPVIANLLHCFDWKLTGGMNEEDMNMEEAPGISISKNIALHLMPVNYIPQAPGDQMN